MKIFYGTSNPPLANAIAASIGLELGKCTVSAFRMARPSSIEENVRGEDVFGPVNLLDQPQSDGDVHHDGRSAPGECHGLLLLPFYGYARQDRKISPRPDHGEARYDLSSRRVQIES